MSITTTRAQRRHLTRTNAKLPSTLVEVPKWEWPSQHGGQLRVWRSGGFLVQEFAAPEPAIVRLSVNRTTVTGGDWSENITWEELQSIKGQCGYANMTAVEVYPSDTTVVNVANMRHMWVLRERPPYAW